MTPTKTAAVEKVNPSTGEIDEERFILDTRNVSDALTFDEALSEAESHGASEELATVVLDPYQKVNKDKDLLLGRDLIVRAVKFMRDKATSNLYVNLWVIRDDNQLFRVTDGSTGMFAQIEDQVRRRLAEGHPTPYNYFRFRGGLTKSEYFIDDAGVVVDEGTKGSTRAATYYFA